MTVHDMSIKSFPANRQHTVAGRVSIFAFRALFLVAVLLEQTTAASEERTKALPGHQVVPVTNEKARNPAEVSVAIDPTNPDHVIAVSLQAGRPGAPYTSDYVY